MVQQLSGDRLNELTQHIESQQSEAFVTFLEGWINTLQLATFTYRVSREEAVEIIQSTMQSMQETAHYYHQLSRQSGELW
jgi:hypothetical protein